jgi:hypothetical protein
VGRAGIKHQKDEKFLYGFDLRIRRKKTAWVNLGIEGRILLKLVPKKLNSKLMEFISLIMSISDCIFRTCKHSKRRGIS